MRLRFEPGICAAGRIGWWRKIYERKMIATFGMGQLYEYCFPCGFCRRRLDGVVWNRLMNVNRAILAKNGGGCLA